MTNGTGPWSIGEGRAGRPAFTPVGMAGRGLLAGLAGTLLLSMLARSIERRFSSSEVAQARGSALAASPTSPAGALAQPQAPGPEGLAQQFAFKVASGILEQDISAAARRIGLAVHLLYGSLWGGCFGLVQGTYWYPAIKAGPVFGAAVWLVGPAILLPAMKLLYQVRDEPWSRTATLLVGHLLYGAAVALTFAALTRSAQGAQGRAS